MAVIEFVLAKPEDLDRELALFFALRNTPIAHKYFAALVEAQMLTIKSPDRIHNFPNTRFDRHTISDQINQCVDAINRYAPGLMPLRAEPQMSQERLNRLHHYFEVLRGPVEGPREFYLRAPASVQAALRQLNLLIHRFEDYERNEKRLREGRPPEASIYVTFEQRERYPLAEGDYAHFTKRKTFGGWYINYCEVGKPIWDVYQDADDVVGDANVRPLRFYSAESVVEFGPTTTETEHELMLAKFGAWWDEHAVMLSRLGFSKGDPANAVGAIPVADLDRGRGAVEGKSEEEIRELIGAHQYISRVVCHDVRERSEAARILEERLPKRLSERPELAWRIKASYQIRLTGEGGGTWSVDLSRGPGGYIGRGAMENPSIKVDMTVADFIELARGAVSPQMAIVQGKLRFEGPARLALELRQMVG
jgi:hypothetical protein